MRTITQSLVEEVWRELTTYPPEKVEAEAAVFLQRQPHVAAFCHSVTRESDESVQKAALGLAFLLFKILEASLGVPFPSVTRARVMDAYEATTAWLAKWEGADPWRFLQSALGGEESPHPTLIRYLLTVFYGGEPENAPYDAEVTSSLFLMLKTLVEAVDIGRVE